MSTVARFHSVLCKMGSNVLYHREDGGTPCPCRTPEGFRDPAWHEVNVGYPVCNEQGYLVTAIEFSFKGSVQPASTRFSRTSQRVNDLLGDVQEGDCIGIFPCEWEGRAIDLDQWSEAGEDFVYYDGRRYSIVSVDKVPDVDGNPSHHYEAGLRLMTSNRPETPDSFLFPDISLYPDANLYPVTP